MSSRASSRGTVTAGIGIEDDRASEAATVGDIDDLGSVASLNSITDGKMFEVNCERLGKYENFRAKFSSQLKML